MSVADKYINTVLLKNTNAHILKMFPKKNIV